MVGGQAVYQLVVELSARIVHSVLDIAVEVVIPFSRCSRSKAAVHKHALV